jgi:hypothetical protein
MVTDSRRGTNALATGGVFFAGVIMLSVGIFHILIGLAAFLGDGFYLDAPNYAYRFEVSGWGWIHVVLGGLVIVSGIGVLVGKVWAYLSAIVLATFSIVDNFLFIPYYPVWSLVLIGFDVLVIWALTTKGQTAVMQ